jgi:alcohol dehydrogenase class IV
MDFGKAVSVLAQNGGESWAYTERADHDVIRPEGALPLIAVPTTSGTGSETTPFAVLNNPDIKEKSTIVSDHIFPRKVIIDPELMLTLPPLLTASTGFDAFAHALEAYMSLSATPFSHMASKRAMEIIAAYLPMAVKDGGDIKARSQMSWAAALGGAAISYVGVTLPHSLGQPVGGMFGAPHGESVAACMAEIVKRSAAGSPEIFAEVSEILDPKVSGLPVQKKAELCPELIEGFLDKINLNVKFSDFGMAEHDIDKAVHIALNGYYFDIKCHPVPITEDDIRQIYKKCL